MPLASPTPAAAAIATVIVSLAAARLCDKIGRRRMIAIDCVSGVVLAFPIISLLNTGTVWGFALAIVLGNGLVQGFAATWPVAAV